MFTFPNLTQATILEGRQGANPKYYRLVFEYIKQEIASLPEFPCLPDDEDMWRLYTDMVNSIVRSLHVMKDIDLSAILESDTVQNTYLMRDEYLSEHPAHNRLMDRAEERLECSEEKLLSEIYSWIYALFQNDSDDYSFQIIQGKIEMMSQFCGGVYDGEQDLDYQDYMNLRSGYTRLKRILLRLKIWPTSVDESSSLVDRMKVILRETIEYIGKYLAAFLDMHKEKCTALREAWEACNMDLPTKEEFAQGLKRVREDLVLNHLDTPDGLVKETWKKFKANLPGAQFLCSSGAVIVDAGPPSLGFPPGGFVQVGDDPFANISVIIAM